MGFSRKIVFPDSMRYPSTDIKIVSNRAVLYKDVSSIVNYIANLTPSAVSEINHLRFPMCLCYLQHRVLRGIR